jgi:hypothetical protein
MPERYEMVVIGAGRPFLRGSRLIPLKISLSQSIPAALGRPSNNPPGTG